MATKRYPIGLQTFERIRKEDWFYVDKTQYVYNLVHTNGTYFFLSRPRRFGKSLLTSTLHSYFEGRKDLFEGLAIDQLETEWTAYPVLHFDLSMGKHMEKDALERYLEYVLLNNEERLGVPSNDENDVNIRMSSLIRNVYQKTGKQVVVLIDEYDAPLLDVVHEEENLPVLRNVMRNFYSPLKACEPMLRFVFLTGITKFSQLSIFSELNNIKNISMDEPYAAICGITKEEMLRDMQEGIEELAQKLELTKEQTIERLTRRYDGYHFTWPSPDIFNPFSLLNCFASLKTEAYWFGSGTPTYLIEMMRKFKTIPSKLGKMRAKASSFDAPTETIKSIIPLLYQSGYITIKDYDKDSEVYTLDIPNEEISIGLFESLLPNYLDSETDEGKVVIADMAVLINRGDMEGALELLRDFLETVPYCDNTLYEGHYQQMMYVIFALLTYYRINIEQHTQRGRTDITMETHNHVYIIELKFNKTAQEALDQIKTSRYAEAFALTGKPITMMGINFSVEEERNITEWLFEDYARA